MGKIGHIYFHSPCFDGIVSSVIVWDFLAIHQKWSDAILHSVNYDAREGWLSSKLESPSAVVDFLYHPGTQLWADHHQTTFLSHAARFDFEKRKSKWMMYNPRSDSCARLIWNQIKEACAHKNRRFQTMVQWADKIDSAHYESVEEAIFGDAPAMRIRSSIVLPGAREQAEDLIRALRVDSLEVVASLPTVSDRHNQVLSLTEVGLNRIKESARIQSNGIVVFDVDATDVIINRYAAYYFFPAARYSVGAVRSTKGTSITAMRNPWREFESIPLGTIFEKFGGGGHQRVASVFLPTDRASEYGLILKRIVQEIAITDLTPKGV